MIGDLGLPRGGYAVLRGVVPAGARRACLRLLWQELRRYGAFACEITEWSHTTWFPWLRDRPEVWACLPPWTGPWAEPQILIRLPDPDFERPPPLIPHVDEPDGAYSLIVGAFLSHGRLAVWPGSHTGARGQPRVVEVPEGAALLLDGGLAHAGVLNEGHEPQVAIYFRRRAA